MACAIAYQGFVKHFYAYEQNIIVERETAIYNRDAATF